MRKSFVNCLYALKWIQLLHCPFNVPEKLFPNNLRELDNLPNELIEEPSTDKFINIINQYH